MDGRRKLLRWVTAVCFVLFLFGCTRISLAQTGKWVAADGTMSPVVESAKLISETGIDGDSTVTVTGTDRVQVSLGTMTMPGAYAEICVTVTNIGNLAANLTEVSEIDCDLDRIVIYFSDIAVEDELALTEGDHCTFSVVVQWDPEDTTDTDGLETGAFAMTLTYENNEMVFIIDTDDETNGSASAGSVDDTVDDMADYADSETGSQASESGDPESTEGNAASTGDRSVVWRWYLLAVAAGTGLLICLRSMRKPDRKI